MLMPATAYMPLYMQEPELFENHNQGRLCIISEEVEAEEAERVNTEDLPEY